MKGIRLIAVVIAVLVPASALAGELAEIGASSRASACCEAMKHKCAGIQAPDDCCQTRQEAMGHVSSAITPGVRVAGSGNPVAVLLSVRVDAPALAASTEAIDVSSFKRPHDPPHLHVFQLLI